jgi:hypothetical protein
VLEQTKPSQWIAIAEGVYGGVIFGPAEMARLEVIFPDGVSDNSQGDSRKP